jgi:hypothetical protein
MAAANDLILQIHKGGSQVEYWLTVYGDGRIEEEWENDGYAILRHGLQRGREVVTLDYVRDNYDPDRTAQVEAALRELGS